MTRLRAERAIAADPTSLALLVAGPAALELWPGVHRTGVLEGRVVVRTTTGATPAEVLVRTLPPRRALGSFVTRFDWRAARDDVPDVSGTLTLSAGGPHATRAVLDLRAADADLARGGLQRMAAAFLANLAATAEARAYAA